MIGARAVGAARRALTLATDWARQRVQHGQAIIGFQLIQAMLADSAVDTATTRALVDQVAWEFDAGGEGERRCTRRQRWSSWRHRKPRARVVDRAVQIFGGRGYLREQPVERLLREVRLDRIWEGTSEEIQRVVIANEIGKRGLAGLLSFHGEAIDQPSTQDGVS